MAVALVNLHARPCRKATSATSSRCKSMPRSLLESLLDLHKNHHLAAQLGVLTIPVILLWQGLAPKKLKVVPVPLVAVVLATLLVAVLVVPVFYVEFLTTCGAKFTSPVSLVRAALDGLFQAAFLDRCSRQRGNLVVVRHRRRSNAPRSAHSIRPRTVRPRRGQYGVWFRSVRSPDRCDCSQFR